MTKRHADIINFDIYSVTMLDLIFHNFTIFMQNKTWVLYSSKIYRGTQNTNKQISVNIFKS